MNKNERLCSLPDTGKTAAEKYDIIVIGGGIAGCSAALAAARHGKRTLLVEKLTVLGGLATTGHITIYLPLDDG